MATTKRPLDIAWEQLTEAATTWAAANLSYLLLGGQGGDQIDEAYTQMRCAAAVLVWEGWRSGGLIEQLDPHYDDATIDALLRGAQG